MPTFRKCPGILPRPDWGKAREVLLRTEGVPGWTAPSRATVRSPIAWDNPLGARMLSLQLMLKINVVMTVVTADSICGGTMLGRLPLATCNEILYTATPSILPVFISPTFLIRFETSSRFAAMCVKMLLAAWPYRWDGLVRPEFDLLLPTPATITKYWNISFKFSSIKQHDTRLYLRRSPANR